MKLPDKKYRIEINLKEWFIIRKFPCGMKLQNFIILEKIWEETGCDISGEFGSWKCFHCRCQYYFQLYYK